MPEITPLQFSDNVKGAFRTFWAAAGFDVTRVAWPGVAFDPKGLDEWVALVINHTPQGRQSIGSSVNVGGSFSQQGVIAIEIYTRQGRSLDRAYVIADSAILFLEQPRAIPNTRTFDLSGPLEIGPDGTWEQVNVTASFVYYTDRL